MDVEFSRETCSILVPVRCPVTILDSLATRAELDGFHKKPEFHVTVLSGVEPTIVNQKLVKSCERAISVANAGGFDMQVIPNAIWRIARPKIVGDESFDRESIVAQVRSQYLVCMYRGLQRYTDLNLIKQPPFSHVTLYTRGQEPYASRGIGIGSWSEFMSLNPERYDNV